MSCITNFGSENSKKMVSSRYDVIRECYVIVIFSQLSLCSFYNHFLYHIGDGEFEFAVENSQLRNMKQLRNNLFSEFGSNNTKKEQFLNEQTLLNSNLTSTKINYVIIKCYVIVKTPFLKKNGNIYNFYSPGFKFVISVREIS